jgi:glycosyltransferase involved in cell wall biosynthesis
LVGEGPEYERLKNNNNNRIFFTGRLDGYKLNTLLDNVHVGIISNALWYQAPLKLFQYSVAGLAVVAVATPTIQELTGADDSFLYFKTKNELYNNLESIILNPQLINDLAFRSRKIMTAKFSKIQYKLFFDKILYR